MVGSRLLLKPWIRFEALKEFKKSLTKGPCVIFYGQIQTIEQVGVCHLVEQDTLLAKTLPNSLIKTTDLFLLLELISLLWTVITGVMNEMS